MLCWLRSCFCIIFLIGAVGKTYTCPALKNKTKKSQSATPSTSIGVSPAYETPHQRSQSMGTIQFLYSGTDTQKASIELWDQALSSHLLKLFQCLGNIAWGWWPTVSSTPGTQRPPATTHSPGPAGQAPWHSRKLCRENWFMPSFITQCNRKAELRWKGNKSRLSCHILNFFPYIREPAVVEEISCQKKPNKQKNTPHTSVHQG